MTRYMSFDPNVEINGRTASAFVVNLNHDDMHEVLVRHGFDNVDPTRWYNLQKLLDVLSDLSEDVNGMENLVALGMAAGQIGLDNLPTEYKNAAAEQGLRAYCEAMYPARQRGGDAGTMTFAVESDNHYVITARVPYPDDLMYGVLYAYLRYYKRPSQIFTLRYDDTVQRREKGGENTIYHILFKEPGKQPGSVNG